MFYAAFNAADSKTLTDGFKQLYPKIDATFYRASDAQLMERILTETAPDKSLGCCDDVELLRLQPEKTRYASRPMIRRNESILSRRLQGSPGDLDIDLHQLCRLRLQHPHGGESECAEIVPDLLKPEWKGNIGIDSRPYEWFGTMVKAMGDEKGLGFMRELAKQAQLRAAGHLVAQLVAAGEFKGGLTAYSQTLRNVEAHGCAGGLDLPESGVCQHSSRRHFGQGAASERGRDCLSTFVLSKRRQELVRGMDRIPDRIDTPPEQARFDRRDQAGVRPHGSAREFRALCQDVSRHFRWTMSVWRVSLRRYEGHQGFGTFLINTMRRLRCSFAVIFAKVRLMT